MKILLVGVFFASVAFAEEIFVNRTCDSYNFTLFDSNEASHGTFDYTKVKNGTWYEIANLGKKAPCISINVTQDGSGFHVTRYANHSLNYTIEPAGDNSSFQIPNTNLRFKLLSKNYDDYIVAWNCSPATNSSSQQILTVASRNKTRLIDHKDVALHEVFFKNTNATWSPSECVPVPPPSSSYTTPSMGSINKISISLFLIGLYSYMF